MKLSTVAREIVNLIRRHDLSYSAFRDAAHAARKHLGLKPTSGKRHLPKILSKSSLEKFLTAVESSEDIQHVIMLKLLFYTALRVSELTNIRLSDVDLSASKIFIESGKGDKDRYVLFPDDFKLVLRSHIAQCRDRRTKQIFLFESKQWKRPYTRRRVHQIVKQYAALSGIEENVHPHLLRHQLLTHLTLSGVSDAKIQLISGHASKKSLEIYQHVSLSAVAEDYQAAVKNL